MRRWRSSASRSRPTSKVVEIASNDGYLLTNFVAAGIPCSASSRPPTSPRRRAQKGVPTGSRSSARETARRLAASRPRADLIVANNVLAHVPDINDFVAGLPHPAEAGRRLHGRVPAPAEADPKTSSSTPSTTSITPICRCSRRAHVSRHGLRVFDVEELPTHGGSLRVFVCHEARATSRTAGVAAVRGKRRSARSTARRLRRLSRARRAGAPQPVDFLKRRGRRAARSPPMARRPRATPCSTTAASAAT